MAEVVNLRRARKARDRKDAEKRASANRTAFGLPKIEREKIQAEQQAASRFIDGHQLDNSMSKPKAPGSGTNSTD